MKRRKLLEVAGVLTAASLIGLSSGASKAMTSTHLGLTQLEIQNANKLLHTLKKTNIYSTTQSHEYVARLILRAISHLNGTAPFSNYSLKNTEFVDRHHNLIVDGTYRWWLAHEAVGGIRKPFPSLSQGMKTSAAKHLTEWLERVRAVKLDTLWVQDIYRV
jgi:hypothetical protein